MGSEITWQDVRLIAGEGKLSAQTVLDACNAVLRMRETRTPPQPSGGEVEAADAIWRSFKRAFWKDARPEYDEIGRQIAVPHLINFRAALVRSEEGGR